MKVLAYAIVSIYVTFVVFGVVGFVYIGHVDHRADLRDRERAREFCGVIRLLDDRNQRLPPPTSQDGRNFVAALHEYRMKLGC